MKEVTYKEFWEAIFNDENVGRFTPIKIITREFGGYLLEYDDIFCRLSEEDLIKYINGR